MNTLARPRRSTAGRLGWATVGAACTGIGVMVAYRLSGYEIDLELIAIIALAALGVWFLITAALAGRRERRYDAAQPGAAPYASSPDSPQG